MSMTKQELLAQQTLEAQQVVRTAEDDWRDVQDRYVGERMAAEAAYNAELARIEAAYEKERAAKQSTLESARAELRIATGEV